MSADGARVHDEQRYPAPPHEVLDVLTDPVFLAAWADGLGARVDGVESSGLDGTRRTALRLGVPTRGIPPGFARFVGAEVAVHDERSWRPDGRGGSTADVAVRARIFGRDAVVRGTAALTPDGDGTLATTTARVSVDAPVVGRQAEAAVASLAAVVLGRQAELLRRRLPGGGPASSSA